jgi:filamentous hemagglutinin family protein
MGISSLGWHWLLVSSFLVGGAGIKAAVAQPVPDETLGGERSQVIDRGGANFDIDGGARRGGNLFHSFQEFNVDQGGSVYFLNPSGIENILSRVTGNNPSNILGTLGVRGAANLFFINPSGILFGPNSRLDVGGSFAATTADAIEFGEQGFFSATNPEAPSQLLSVAPSAFFFNQLANGDIVSRSITSTLPRDLLGLRVPDGETLLLLGGNVSIDGGNLADQRSGLHAPGGRVEIGSVSGSGRVGLNPDGSLTLTDGLARGDVTIQNRGIVDVRSATGGTLALHADNIRITGESELLAGILPNQGTAASQAGNIALDATGAIQVQQFSRVANQLGVGATGATGDIVLTTGSLLVAGGSRISTLMLGTGEAGSVVISASEEVRVQGINRGRSSGVLSVVGEPGTGRSGNVAIRAPILEVLNRAELNSRTEGRGDAGNVILIATDRILFNNNVTVSSTVTNRAKGQGGNVEITAPILEVFGGSELNASTFGQGDAGDILIRADEVSFQAISVENQPVPRGGALSRVARSGRGQGGNIRIETAVLEMLNGARLSANTLGQGDAGNIYITASDRVRFEGLPIEPNQIEPDQGDPLETRGGAFSTIETPRGATIDLTRQGGNIEITTPILEVFNGAQLQTSTDGRGDAGDVIIRAGDRIRFAGRSGAFASGALSTVETRGVGQGGNIQIETAVLEVVNGARLNASTQGQGDAGNIAIRAADRVRFQGFSPSGEFSGALSRVDRRGTGQGGTIRIRTSVLEVLNGARLTANTDGRGSAGNINIRASDRVRFQGVIPNGQFGGAFVRVDANGVGQGGNLRIRTSVLEVLDGAQLQTNTAGQGDAGNINILSDDRVRFEGRTGRFPSGAFSLVAKVGDEQNGDRGGLGQGGSIRIAAPIVEILNGARLNANTEWRGDAGSVMIRATDRVVLDGIGQDRTQNEDENQARFSSAIFTITQATASGRGGTVEITAPLVRVANAAVINAGTNSVLRGGDITINANEIEILNGGQIITTTGSEGRAGNIILDADRIRLSGRYSDADAVQQFEGQPLEDNGASGLFASTRSDSTGNGGRITVNATNLTLQDGARISAQSQGTGMAGNIRLNVSEQLQLTNSDILTIADRSSGGDITVNAADDTGLIILRGDSDITTNSQGNGGNITLRGSGIIAFDDSDILARSQDARGGNITLDAFFSQTGSLSSEVPFDGNDRVDVNADGEIESGTITTPDTSIIQNSLAELPDTAIDTDTLVSNSCVVQSREEMGSFTITGPGGLPQRPGTLAPSLYPTAPVRSMPDQPDQVDENRNWQPGDPIVEPQGAYQLEDGRIVLSRECL